MNTQPELDLSLATIFALAGEDERLRRWAEHLGPEQRQAVADHVRLVLRDADVLFAAFAPSSRAPRLLHLERIAEALESPRDRSSEDVARRRPVLG